MRGLLQYVLAFAYVHAQPVFTLCGDKSVFTFTGNYQTFSVNATRPSASLLFVKLWGATGGGNVYWGNPAQMAVGGAGAFVAGYLNSTPAEYRVIIGAGGAASSTTVPSQPDFLGCGGGVSSTASTTSSGGGGRTAIQQYVSNVWVEVVTAGGGGGSQTSITVGGNASWFNTSFSGRGGNVSTAPPDYPTCYPSCGGGGGAGAGASPFLPGSAGGTASGSGTRGCGGTGVTGGGGGGGGYYGGGGGSNAAGGGGSSNIFSLISPFGFTGFFYADPDYIPGVNTGVYNGPGGNGLLVVQLACCPGGYICNKSSITPTAACPAGNYCPAGSSAPTTCPRGHFCPTGTTSSAHLNCGRGNYCPLGSASPLPCPIMIPPIGGWGVRQVQGPAFLVETAACLAHCFFNQSSTEAESSC